VPEGLRSPRTPIPTHLKAAVYFFGFDPAEIVELEYLTGDCQRVKVHLRSVDGTQEWKGNLDAPPWQIPMSTIRVADLIAGTEDCPHCRGSGKVLKRKVVTQK
jgi:hypothetical protein